MIFSIARHFITILSIIILNKPNDIQCNDSQHIDNPKKDTYVKGAMIFSITRHSITILSIILLSKANDTQCNDSQHIDNLHNDT